MVSFRLSILSLTLVAAPAFAHPELVSGIPAAGSTVAAPARISLQMSETLVPQMSGATLTMTGMPGMASHPPMTMPAKTSVGPDGKTLILMPAKKLPAGHYRVDWHGVSSDTHRITGTHEFDVK